LIPGWERQKKAGKEKGSGKEKKVSITNTMGNSNPLCNSEINAVIAREEERRPMQFNPIK